MKPKIRFSSSNILYEEKTLSEISTINPKTNVPLEFEYVDLESVSGTEMTNHRTEHKATAPSRAQRLAKKGDIFYQTVRPYQKNNYYFDMDDDNYVFSTGYAQIRPSIYGKYLFTLLQNDSFLKQVLDNCAGTSFPAINPSVLSRLSVRICKDKQEQQAIASYFTSLDSQISASTSRLASLKQMKAASLQAMFPQEGETVPKIRFKGFEGKWKKVKFKEFGHVAMCKRIFKNQTTSEGDVPFYKIGTFGSEPDSYISQSLFEEYKKKYPFPNKGDILISAAGTIGRTVEYNGENCYYQDSNIVWLDHNNNITNGFLKQLYSIVKWSSLEGATIKRLYNSNILETTFYIPNINEQQAIASYFTSLDRQISLQSQRLEKLKQIKSACLDKMFV